MLIAHSHPAYSAEDWGSLLSPYLCPHSELHIHPLTHLSVSGANTKGHKAKGLGQSVCGEVLQASPGHWAAFW